jgi:hypothetical protein
VVLAVLTAAALLIDHLYRETAFLGGAPSPAGPLKDAVHSAETAD